MGSGIGSGFGFGFGFGLGFGFGFGFGLDGASSNHLEQVLHPAAAAGGGADGTHGRHALVRLVGVRVGSRVTG